MTDQCKHCLVRGDWERCNAESCFHHENWYSVELRKALAQKEAECAELKEQIKKDHDDCTRCNDTDLHAENAELRERVKELKGDNPIKGTSKLHSHKDFVLKKYAEVLNEDKSKFELKQEISSLCADNTDLTRQLEELKECNAILGKQWKDGLDEKFTLMGQLEEARKALYAADKFITNGVELGFIRMPDEDVPDPAKLTPGIVKAALAALAGKEK